MQKNIILSQTVYNLYWRRNLQLHTPNEDIIKLFLMSARDRGDKLTDYHINSNIAAGYDVNSFLDGQKLPECWKVA